MTLSGAAVATSAVPGAAFWGAGRKMPAYMTRRCPGDALVGEELLHLFARVDGSCAPGGVLVAFFGTPRCLSVHGFTSINSSAMASSKSRCSVMYTWRTVRGAS